MCEASFALSEMDMSDDPLLILKLFDALVLLVISNDIGYGATRPQRGHG